MMDDVFARLPPERSLALRRRLRALENRILEGRGGRDGGALWPELAVLYTALGQIEDAATCWLNALWEADVAPPRWMDLWNRAEFPDGKPCGRRLEAVLALKTPSPANVRALAAWAIWAA